MKHVSAFVLVATIAGTPVNTLACVGWCVPDAMPVSASCHDHQSGAGASLHEAASTCADLFIASPFLTEDVQLTRAAMPASAPHGLYAPGEAQLVSVRDVAPPMPPRSTSPLALRL